jgi:hypothetical protein
MKIENPNNYRDFFLNDYLYETGFFGSFDTLNELERSKFFIIEIEQYVSSSESAELKQLSKGTEHFTKEQKDEFWQIYYPVHWQEIFGVRIRSSFCVQLCSLVEATLSDVANRIHIIENCPQFNKMNKPRFKRGTTLDKYKLYFREKANLNRLDDQLWINMSYIFRIRNAHIHFQGFDHKLEEDNDFKNFLSSIPGIRFLNSFIDLRQGACEAFLDISHEFLTDLLENYSSYRVIKLQKYEKRKQTS